MAEGIRLNKALADAGVCSRRRADELVFAGRVCINGTPAESPGQRVLPGDTVSLDGRAVRMRAESAAPCWLMLNKPVRIVSTASDPEGRETVAATSSFSRGAARFFFGRTDSAYRRRRTRPSPHASALASFKGVSCACQAGTGRIVGIRGTFAHAPGHDAFGRRKAGPRGGAGSAVFFVSRPAA